MHSSIIDIIQDGWYVVSTSNFLPSALSILEMDSTEIPSFSTLCFHKVPPLLVDLLSYFTNENIKTVI